MIKLSNIEKSYELVGGERVPALKVSNFIVSSSLRHD